jgi:serine/threonine protein kinase
VGAQANDVALERCPDNATLEALLLGEIDEALRSVVLKHADLCGACAEALALLFQPSAERSQLLPVVAHSNVGFATTEYDERGSREDATLAAGFLVTRDLTIRGAIGAGGMGTVYHAFHAGLGCDVAVKILRSRLPSEDAKLRLLREARVLAQLPTEHVVRIFDVGTLESGEPYLVMELLKGKSLRDHMRQYGPFEPADASALAIRICRAVAAAHALGVVHRDLKPDNIFLSPEGAIKILDFGLSKLGADLLSGTDAALTHSGAFLGTPLYVAPEQVREAQTVDARADVWAIGVILYELLTGNTPFRRRTVGAVLAAVLTEPAPRLTSLAGVRGVVPPRLTELIAQCLQVSPDQRPADAAVLADLFESFPQERFKAHPRRRGFVSPVLVIVTGLASLGVLFGWKTPRRMLSSRELHLAVSPPKEIPSELPRPAQRTEPSPSVTLKVQPAPRAAEKGSVKPQEAIKVPSSSSGPVIVKDSPY